MLKEKKGIIEVFYLQDRSGFKNYREHYIAFYIPVADPQTLLYAAADAAPPCLVQSSSSGATISEGISILARAEERQW